MSHNKKFFVIFGLFSLFSSPLKAKDITLSGRLNVELTGEEAFRVGDSDQDGIIKFKTKRYEQTRAIIELRGSTNSQNVFFREAYIDHKIAGGDNRLLVGKNKKRFGLEYEHSLEDRIGLIRGPAYRKLESFAFVGRDLSLSYSWNDSKDFSQSHYRLAYHSNDGIAHGVIFHWRARGTKDLYYSQWTLFQGSENGDRLEASWSHISALWWESGQWRGSAEIIGGKDPLETVFQKNQGNSKNIYFMAAKSEASVMIGNWEPMLQSNFIIHDTDRSDFQTFQALLGFRYYFSDRFRMGINIEYLTSASAAGETRLFETIDTQTNGILVARYFF